MHIAALLAITLLLTLSPARAQNKPGSKTDVITLQNTSGNAATTVTTVRDSAATDTNSPRARRVRAPRPPRPGIFTSLDSARTMPDSVIYLTIRGKGLTTLTGLAAFKNLQVLDVSGNNLSAFPMEALKLPKLASIDLSDNPIKTVPQEIGSLTGLTRLNLRNTSITTLPATIGSLQILMSLDVSKNPLVSLPIKELNLLPRLKNIIIGQLPPREEAETPAAESKTAEPEAKPAAPAKK